MKFYFGESIADLTLPVLKSRVAFLHGSGGGSGEAVASQGNTAGIANAAHALMSKSGRKEIPLNEILGMGVI